jgi:hypothetical protein
MGGRRTAGEKEEQRAQWVDRAGHHRIELFPGVTLNLSRSGISTSIGRRGAHFTVGPCGARRSGQEVGRPQAGRPLLVRLARKPLCRDFHAHSMHDVRRSTRAWLRDARKGRIRMARDPRAGHLTPRARGVASTRVRPRTSRPRWTPISAPRKQLGYRRGFSPPLPHLRPVWAAPELLRPLRPTYGLVQTRVLKTCNGQPFVSSNLTASARAK